MIQDCNDLYSLCFRNISPRINTSSPYLDLRDSIFGSELLFVNGTIGEVGCGVGFGQVGCGEDVS